MKGLPVFLLVTSVAIGFCAIFLYKPLRDTTHQLVKASAKILNEYVFGSAITAKSSNKKSSAKSSSKVAIDYLLAEDEDTLFTKAELAKYDGSPGSLGLYLAILGRVYDVSKGAKHYGPGGGYSFFAATDGTKAFVTGEFNEEGLVDSTEGIQLVQVLEIEDWVKFYNKDYTYKGKLEGNFYDSRGKPKKALHHFFKQLEDARADKHAKEADKRKFPPCNSSYKKGEHRTVWCTQKSGGIERPWVGFPRQYFEQGRTKPRCACVHENDLKNPLIKEYDDCDPRSDICALPHTVTN